MKKTLILLVLITAAMYFTNPDRTDFKHFVQKHLNEKMVKEEGSDFENALKGGAANMGAELVAGMAKETNLYIMRVFTVDTGKKEYNYLGLFKIFIPLQMDSPLEEEEL